MQNVLIIEDDIHIQDIFRIIFNSYGYHVSCVGNGEKIDSLSLDVPDIIILDKQLPGISGIEVCKKLKSDEHTSSIPIIMISALTGVGMMALTAGADDYIEKPFNMHILLKKVFQLLEKRNKSIQ